MKCFDTYALVAMLHGNPVYSKYVRENFFIPDTTLAEFSRVLLRTKSQDVHDVWVSQLELYARPVGRDLLLNAMAFRHAHPNKDFSFFDAVGFVASLRERCPFVTGDEAFRGMQNVEFVKEAR